MGYLDYAGLQHLWDKLKEKFAPKRHNHDDRYYTESEMDGKLNSKVNNNEVGANDLLSKLTTSWTATPTDDTYFIRQGTGGGNTFGRVKFSTIWNYIKGKADGTYQPKGSYAASGHTHDDRYYTEAEVDGKLSGKSNTDHTHDDRYYTESEVETKLKWKADINHIHLNGTKTGAIDWNTFTTYGVYKIQNCTMDNAHHAPPDEYAFGILQVLDSENNGGEKRIIQIYWPRSTAKGNHIWYRMHNSSDINAGWSGWTQIKKKPDTAGYADSAGSVAWGNISGKPSSYPPSSHTHDDRYYTEAEVNTKLNGKSNTGHTHDDRYYTETEIDTKLNGKAPNGHTHQYLSLYGARPANINFTKSTNGTGAMFHFVATSSTTTGKPPAYSSILQLNWDNSGGWDSQLALSTTANPHVYYRNQQNGTWGNWSTLLDNLNYTDYAAKKEHTHTKSQITDFPASLKNPTSLTIQTNGTTAATYDGSAAKTVNITKGNIGLGNVDNTADKNKSVASAAKLTTARTVSGGSDITLSFNYDGSGNSTANIGFYSCKHLVGNTNNYPFHRFAKLDNLTGAYTDRTMLVYITQDYNGGGFGICRLSLRINSSSSASTVEAKWLVRSGLSADFVQVAIYNVYGKTYADAFIKINGTYGSTTISALESGRRGTKCRTWILVDSNEVDGTTATDKKTSSECWKTIAEAGVGIHKQEYSSSASAIDKGYVASAGSSNTSSSCTGNSASATKLTSSAGSAIQPVYFKDGKPVAGTYMLGDASSKMVRTLGAVGNTGWENKTTDDKYVPTMSFMAYWNGAYSNTSSNLQYCDRGRFGTIVTKNTGDYAVAWHTHNSIKDIGNNSSDTTFAYSKAGMNYGDYTWLAGWNGYELRAINKNQFATAGQGVTASGKTDAGIYYVRFGNGTQMCWGFYKESDHSGSTSFPVAFNNSQYSLSLTVTVSSNNAPYITGRSTTGFSYARHGTSYNDVQWIAVGTWK